MLLRANQSGVYRRENQAIFAASHVFLLGPLLRGVASAWLSASNLRVKRTLLAARRLRRQAEFLRGLNPGVASGRILPGARIRVIPPGPSAPALVSGYSSRNSESRQVVKKYIHNWVCFNFQSTYTPSSRGCNRNYGFTTVLHWIFFSRINKIFHSRLNNQPGDGCFYPQIVLRDHDMNRRAQNEH